MPAPSLFGVFARNSAHSLEGLPVDRGTRDAADRLAILSNDHRNADLVTRLEHFPAPAAVNHIRRIAYFGGPMYAISLLVLYVELEQAMRILPDPVCNDSLYRHAFRLIIYCIAMMREQSDWSGENTESQEHADNAKFSVHLTPRPILISFQYIEV